MATLVCFHAHPDDESIATAGVMCRAAEEGHRVVLVVATRGDHGEVAEGVLRDGERLADRRVAETHASARILGADRVEFLPYLDSGMMGEATNDHPDCFWQADVDEAAERLAGILRDEGADVLTVYDDNGSYGHPDHIQVHRVGIRAAELAGVTEVFEATANRDQLHDLMHKVRESGAPVEGTPADIEEGEELELGVPADRITTAVDVRPWLQQKRDSMRAHASQIAEQSFFLAMPDDVFAEVFGTEWFIHRGVATPVERWEPWLFGEAER